MIKLAVLSPDASGRIDPSIGSGILQHIPQVSLSDCDAVIVPIAYMSDFRFNAELFALKKRVVLIDMVEFGWDAGSKENRLGAGALRNFGHLTSDEWARLDNWVFHNPPVLTFKRELLARNRTDTMLPIEFPCRIPAPPMQSKAEFDARPIEVFNLWGLSNPARPRLHGAIFQNAHDKGIHVVDAWDQDGRFEKRTWATIHSPHYNRKSINEVMHWQWRAKISVSLPGAGVCCFRSAESPVGAVMALQNDDKVWSYPWIHGDNCIRMRPGYEFQDLEFCTYDPNFRMFEIYIRSQETVEKYRSANYVRDYVLREIEQLL